MSLAEVISPVTSDPELDDADPIFTHVVQREEGEDKQSAAARVTEARVMGTPVTALCGHVWVPSRNPENHPICEKCKEMLPFAMAMKGF